MAILLELEGDEKENFIKLKARTGLRSDSEVARFAIKHTVECKKW